VWTVRELRRPPGLSSSAGAPSQKAGAANLGGLLFGYFLFGRARESDQLPGCPRRILKVLGKNYCEW